MVAASLFHRYYDAIFSGKDYQSEADAVLAVGGLVGDRAARILEVGAGTGNHSLALARRGHRIVAVDTDPAMVALARQKIAAGAAELRERIDVIAGGPDACGESAFDLAVAMFNVVNYLPDLKTLQAFMAAVATRLKPGAAFVFDAWNAAAAITDPPAVKDTEVRVGELLVTVHLVPEIDWMQARVDLVYHLCVENPEEGTREQETHHLTHTVWPSKVLADAARMAGLWLERLVPLNNTSRPAAAEDWKILFVCRARQGISLGVHE